MEFLTHLILAVPAMMLGWAAIRRAEALVIWLGGGHRVCLIRYRIIVPALTRRGIKSPVGNSSTHEWRTGEIL